MSTNYYYYYYFYFFISFFEKMTTNIYVNVIKNISFFRSNNTISNDLEIASVKQLTMLINCMTRSWFILPSIS